MNRIARDVVNSIKLNKNYSIELLYLMLEKLVVKSSDLSSFLSVLDLEKS
jgi:hypothetical protein